MQRCNEKKLPLTFDELILTQEFWDECLRTLDKQIKAQKLKRDHPYLLDLVHVLWSRPAGIDRQKVLVSVRETRERLGLPIPPSFDAVVQGTYGRFCIDSDIFWARHAPTSEALFCWPYGKGDGWWAIRAEEADRWLADFLATMKPARR
jgi:hypothetical protein